jgi:hypothetical protein
VKVTIDPAVIARVAQLAGIKDSPFPLFQTTSTGYVFRTTLRERFEIMIESIVSTAHYLATCNNAATPKAAAKIGRSARQLSKDLESSGLSLWFLASDIAAINHLTKQARDFEGYGRIKSRAKAAEVFRKTFVSQLLDAADDAGGHLGINRRTGRGSLVEAIDLLRPYLPAEFQTKLSIATLRRIAQSQSKLHRTQALSRKKHVAQKSQK